ARLQQVAVGGSVQTRVLVRQAWALRSLQSALSEPRHAPHQDLVPAAWLLTLAELLDDQNGADWQTHAAGTTALLKAAFTSTKPIHNPDWRELMPTLLDAFLNCEDVVAGHEPWQAVIRPLIADCVQDEALASAVADQLITTAAVVAEYNAMRVATRLSRSDTGRDGLALLYHASEARIWLERAVLDVQAPTMDAKNDVVGLCMAALVSLEKIITSLGPVNLGNVRFFKGSSPEFCTKLLQYDLGRYNTAFAGPHHHQ
ncbi:hypothetical protein LTR53_017384, partial [Teratosphaeriaceae sp. CCFEE 6253]